MSFTAPSAYEILEEKEIPEIGTRARLLRHRKSGAHVMVLPAEDSNKVFCIGFRTPSLDSTGAAHINEHTVLCGSRRFPLKDPFMELVKGSMNTFLNAVTYPDRTLYPVASCNDKDFKNLMDVYLDAVFHPLNYESRRAFLQEGWHYEMEDEDAPLQINGVVYNEMKGDFSSPDTLLENGTRELLFPHTPYRWDSGGDPDHITELTYEAFLDFHRKYYHPSNSYIYLYGDSDMEERLTYLDEAFLKEYDARPVDSEIPEEETPEAPRRGLLEYPVLEEEPLSGNAYLSWSAVTGHFDDPAEAEAMQILEQVLLNVPGAPLRQALNDAGIGTDVYGGYNGNYRQPFFDITVREADEADLDRFEEVIRTTLEKICEEGLSRRSLLSALNVVEFHAREADFGSLPKGLVYGLQVYDVWMYDADPMIPLGYEEVFRTLRARMEEGWFEQLIRERFLENPHRALVAMKPRRGLREEKEKALREKLDRIKREMSPEQIREIVRQAAELKKYQETPDPPEKLALLPMLERGDLSREVTPLINEMREAGGVPVLTHPLPCGGVQYVKLLFDMRDLTEEEIRWAGLVQWILAYVDTERHGYRELREDIDLCSGGMSFYIAAQNKNKGGEYAAYFGVRTKVLDGKLPEALSLIREILESSDLRSEKRMAEVMAEVRSRARLQITEAANSAAASRAAASHSPAAALLERCDGIEFYQFVEQLEPAYKERAEETARMMTAVLRKLCVSRRLLISLTASPDRIDEALCALADFAGRLPEGEACGEPAVFSAEKTREGFCFSSAVQYVARSGSYAGTGLVYTGALSVLRTILDDEYLWKEVREKGGAYGCSVSFGRSGGVTCVSYRDPHLKRTDRVYRELPAYVASFDAPEREMTKYIIGTVSSIQRPMTPNMLGNRSLYAWISGTTEEMLKKELEEVLNAEPADIRALAGHVRAALESGALCVLGGDRKLREDADILDSVVPLIKGDSSEEE